MNIFLNHLTELIILLKITDCLAEPAQSLGSDFFSHVLPIMGEEGNSPCSRCIEHLLCVRHCTRRCLVILPSPALYPAHWVMLSHFAEEQTQGPREFQ